METTPDQAHGRERLRCLARAGLLTGIVDGLFAITLAEGFYGSTWARMFQGVASVPLGRGAFEGGLATVAAGVLLHFAVAFGWSGVFLFLVLRWSWARSVLGSPHGIVKVALLYGPFVWCVMSLVVIPLFLQRPPAVGVRWWVNFVGHFPFVGIPIVASSARAIRPSGE